MIQIHRLKSTLNGTRPKFIHRCRAGFNLAIFPLAATLLLIAILLVICEVGPGALPRAFLTFAKRAPRIMASLGLLVASKRATIVKYVLSRSRWYGASSNQHEACRIGQ